MCSTSLLIIVGFVVGGVQQETPDITRTDDNKLSLVMTCDMRMAGGSLGLFYARMYGSGETQLSIFDPIHLLFCCFYHKVLSLTMRYQVLY